MEAKAQIQIFDSPEEAAKAEREAMIKLSPRERLAILTKIIGAEKYGPSDRSPRVCEVIDVPLPTPKGTA